jgi:hypothetical protein
MKQVNLAKVDVDALNRASDALYGSVDVWTRTRHPIDRVVAGNLNSALGESMKLIISSYPEMKDSYSKVQNALVWVRRTHPVCKVVDTWMAQWSLTHYATTSPLENTPSMNDFDKTYKQLREDPSKVEYKALREFGLSAILSGQVPEFMEIYTSLRKPI